MTKPICKTDGCTNVVYTAKRGICGTCFNRLKRSGVLGHPPCEIDGCDNPQEAKKLCNKHWIEDRKLVKQGLPGLLERQARETGEEIVPARPIAERKPSFAPVLTIDDAIAHYMAKRKVGWGPSDFDYSHPAFRSARKEAIERSDGMCQFCGLAEATDAHHWAPPGSYPAAEDTLAKDLTAVCSDCHHVATAIRRQAGRAKAS